MWPCTRRSRRGTTADEPLAQLHLISSELDRELASVSARQANAVTRASIVLAAAGVTAFSVTSTSSLSWTAVPTIFSLLSALLSIGAIRYWKSKAMVMKRTVVAPYLKSAPFQVLKQLVRDKFKELDASRRDLHRKSSFLTWAVTMLVLAWTSAVAIRFVVDPILTGKGY